MGVFQTLTASVPLLQGTGDDLDTGSMGVDPQSHSEDTPDDESERLPEGMHVC